MKRRFFPYMSIGVIPTSFLESLTYFEQIMCINNKLNEIINYLDEFSLEEIEKIIQEQIDIIKNYIDNQDDLLYNKVNNELTTQINLLTEMINNKTYFLINYIDNSNIVLKNEIMEELNELKNKIDEIISKGINLYDPTTGYYNNIQNVVYNLYSYLRYYGITALEFDSLSLSAQQFQNYNLTARFFDLYSRCKLLIDFNHNMFSPFTGEITPLHIVINNLAELHKNAITCQNFDSLNITSQIFDNKNLSAYDFDWNGINLLTVDTLYI